MIKNIEKIKELIEELKEDCKQFIRDLSDDSISYDVVLTGYTMLPNGDEKQYLIICFDKNINKFNYFRFDIIDNKHDGVKSVYKGEIYG